MNTIKNSDTRKIQLAIANNIISSIDNDQKRERESERERVINDEADKRTVIK